MNGVLNRVKRTSDLVTKSVLKPVQVFFSSELNFPSKKILANPRVLPVDFKWLLF